MLLCGEPGWPFCNDVDWLFSRGPDWTIPLSSGLDWAAALVTLVSVFVGAILAFALQYLRENIKSRQQNIDAINRAHFTLLQYWEILDAFKKEHIDKLKGPSPNRYWLTLNPALTGHMQPIPMVTDGLNFILSSKEPSVCTKLFFEEQGYNIFLKLVEDRYHAYVGELMPKIEQVKRKLGESPPYSEIESGVGEVIHLKLKDMTDSLVSTVNSNLNSIPTTHNSLMQFAKKMYPKGEFIEIKFLSEKAKEEHVA